MSAIDVEPFILAWPIGAAIGGTQNFARHLARGRDPAEDQIHVRRIGRLIVGVVERFLVHVAPDQRAGRGGGLLHAILGASFVHSRECGNPALDRRLRGSKRNGCYPKIQVFEELVALLIDRR